MSALHLRAVLRDRGLDASLDVAEGETVALLGPNGAGKSSLLSVIAGLITPDEGTVTLGGRSLDGVRPHRRGVALLAQDALLFPHLTVLENVAFAPRARGMHRRAAHEVARTHLRQVGVEQLADRRPHQISGGQAQRVAVARALAADPELLMLDEPMAALDVAVAPELRQTLRSVLAGRTALVVTHDLLDALLLADRVVVLEQGRVVEDGPTAQVLSAPRSEFAARLAGLDLVRGTWTGEAVHTPAGEIHGMAQEPLRTGDAVTALFRPAAVSIFTGAAALEKGSPRNRLATTITDLEPQGDRVRVRGRAGGVLLTAEVTPAAVAELGLAPDVEVTFAVKATDVSVHGTFKPEQRPDPPRRAARVAP